LEEKELRRSSAELIDALRGIPYRYIPAQVINAMMVLRKALGEDKISCDGAAKNLLDSLKTIERTPHNIVGYVDQLNSALAAVA
jgi:hypothetical protein